MEKNKCWIPFALLVLLLSGCAATQGKFNHRYLPEAVPNSPNVRIEFNSSQNHMIEKYLRSPNLKNDVALFWLVPDRIYLNLDGAEILSVDPADASASVLNADDTTEITQALSRKVTIENTASEKGALSQVASYLFSYAGQRYKGEISDDSGQSLNVELETDETRDVMSTEKSICESARLIGKLADGKGAAIPVEWEYNCEWLSRSLADEKVPQLLRKVQISPDGKMIFFENSLYGARMSPAGDKIIYSYPYAVSSSICPDWTKIAILRGKGNKYWMEIFNLHI